MIEERVERGARSAAGIKHIVHQDHVFVVHVEFEFARIHHRLWPGG